MTDAVREVPVSPTLADTMTICADALGQMGSVASILGRGQIAEAQVQLSVVIGPCLAAARAWLQGSGLTSVL